MCTHGLFSRMQSKIKRQKKKNVYGKMEKKLKIDAQAVAQHEYRQRTYIYVPKKNVVATATMCNEKASKEKRMNKGFFEMMHQNF